MKAQDTDKRLEITYALKEGAIGYDVVEVSKVLVALNTDFKQWIKEQRYDDETKKILPHLRLTITSVKEGSILIELVGAVAASVVSAAVIDWAKDLGKRLLGISDGDGLTGVNSQYITNCKNLVGDQTMSIVNINITGDNNNITFPDQQTRNIHYNLEEASREVSYIEEKVSMIIVMAYNRPGKDAMALVEKFWPEPKPLVIPQEVQLFVKRYNPFTTEFLVDLEVIEKNGEIIRYKLLKVHGEFV